MTATTFQPVPRWLYLLRWLPRRLPGKSRLAVLLCSRVSAGPIEIRTGSLIFCAPSIREPVVFRLVADGIYDPDTCEVIRRALRRDGTLLDVGANIGAMSLRAARHYCPAGRVLGFEASPSIFRYLAHNAEANVIPNFTPLHRAVTCRDGDALTFFDAPEAHFGMGSLANRFGGSGVSVPTITLDTAVAQQRHTHVDVIKVDVEGFELGVFQGAIQLLRQTPAPVIVFEFNDWGENRPENDVQPGAAQRFLLEQGYRLQLVRDYLAGKPAGTVVLTQGGADLVAVRP